MVNGVNIVGLQNHHRGDKVKYVHGKLVYCLYHHK